MRTAYLFIALIFSCFINAQQPPDILGNYSYETAIVSTEDGEEFITWIVEDNQAEDLAKKLKSLPKIDVDRSEN